MSEFIKTLLPWIGTALGGPFGALAATAAGKALGLEDKTVDNVKEVLTGLTQKSLTPEQISALTTADYNFQIKMADLGYTSIKELAALEVANMHDVNSTMQAEVGAEHWPSYSWRPFIGFMFGAYIASLWILPLFNKTPVVLTPDLTITIGGILGIAAFFRGKAEADPAIPPKIQIPSNHTVVKTILGQGK
jgi:hypothetical protein